MVFLHSLGKDKNCLKSKFSLKNDIAAAKSRPNREFFAKATKKRAVQSTTRLCDLPEQILSDQEQMPYSAPSCFLRSASPRISPSDAPLSAEP